MPTLSRTMQQVLQNLDAAGVSLRTFATLAAMPISTLHDVTMGKFALKTDKEQRLLKLSVRALEVAESLRPLSFLQGQAVQPLGALILSDKSPEQIREFVNAIFQ
jgi:predicted transcriptional regulator